MSGNEKFFYYYVRSQSRQMQQLMEGVKNVWKQERKACRNISSFTTCDIKKKDKEIFFTVWQVWLSLLALHICGCRMELREKFLPLFLL